MNSSGSNQYDYIFKVLLFGDSGCGKTNLRTRFVTNEFNISSTTTIGVDIIGKNIRIIDPSGQERYHAVTSSFYRNADAALLIYDISYYESFSYLDYWLQELRGFAKQDITVMLVGNKSDLHPFRAVPVEEAVDYAKRNQMSFFETSALDSTNVQTAFASLLAELCLNVDLHPAPSYQHGDTVELLSTEKECKKKCNC